MTCGSRVWVHQLSCIIRGVVLCPGHGEDDAMLLHALVYRSFAGRQNFARIGLHVGRRKPLALINGETITPSNTVYGTHLVTAPTRSASEVALGTHYLNDSTNGNAAV